MEFNDNRPIYLQIYDNICEQILTGALKPDERIMSVRQKERSSFSRNSLISFAEWNFSV